MLVSELEKNAEQIIRKNNIVLKTDMGMSSKKLSCSVKKCLLFYKKVVLKDKLQKAVMP